MKKKILALFLSVHMLLSVMTPSFYASADWFKSNTAGSVEEEEELLVSGPSVTVTSIFPECTLEWTSFSDYIFKQASTAWNSPETYVGYEVEFLPFWQSAECVSGFSGSATSAWPSLKSSEIKTNNQIDPSEFKMVIDGYYFKEEDQTLWYKVKAAEGYVLPEVLEQNPYVLYLDSYTLQNKIPTFIIGSVKAVFNSTTGSVNVKKQAVAASAWDTVDVSALSPVFDVTPVYQNSQYTNHYDVGDLAAEYTEYYYVEEAYITLIPAEVTAAYEKLLSAEDTYEYYEIMQEIPEEILAQFSEQHRAALDECIEALAALEQVRYQTTVDFGGVMLPIVVVGKLPEGVELQASVVPNATVFAEGFDVKEDFSDIIAALDIKLVYTADGTEWQPKEGRRVGVSIGLGALGYEEGAVVRLQHKHDDFIEDYQIAIVQDEFLTVYTSGFSIYAVTSVTDTTTNNATQINNGGTVTLEVGKDQTNEYIFYFYIRNNNSTRGTWTLEDPTGALHYTVHSSTPSAGNGGVYAPWITIHPLKVASGIKLSFSRGGNTVTTETYTVNVVAPKGGDGGRDYKLYIKDDVNKNGKITAALVDKDGNEIENGLDGAAFEWHRSDDYLINTTAYEDGYRSVNIALDHSGLVEARKTYNQRGEATGFQPTTYTLKATLSDGKDYYAYYTVYYQSEIINADFEFPTASDGDNYAFFPNGWPELYWKTTAPGSGSNLTKDVEYGVPSRNGSTGFGVTKAASNLTMAELNAEAFGALYQDVISVPGEEIVWNFSHAPRQDQSWSGNTSNAMFIVLGPTETAQMLEAADLKKLGAQAKNKAGADNTNFLSGKEPVEVEYVYVKDETEIVATYTVWYHDAGTVGENGRDENNNRFDYGAGNNFGWTNLEGSYITPANQYRTRLFFMSEEKANSESASAGNLIDQAKGGQYRKYVIEYWSEVLQGDQQHKRELLKEVKGEALLHSSVKLEDLATYMNSTAHPYYLHKILINGGNYPYNVRYEGDASLYVEKYEPVSNFFDDPKYADYDIVMQVYLRDVATTVQVQLNFPEKMTEAQKLSVIETLKGYQTTVKVVEVLSDGTEGEILDVGVATITKRDPKGNYTAYYYFEDDIYLTKGTTYHIVQTSLPDTDELGLELEESGGTVYHTYYYEKGAIAQTVSDEKDADIYLNGERGFAEVVIVNTYKEKTTTIYYKGVGNGKVAFANVKDEDLDFVDTPTEELAFYSGEAIGAKVFVGEGATFKGWFKDEACTDPVTPKDGVWDDSDDSFKPNANIINDTEVTFYAKFETGSVVIERQNARPGQTFVYCIENSSNNLKMYVTLKCDASGSGTVAILEAARAGTYTVTELNDWSWRHDGEEQSGQHQGNEKELKFTFTGEAKIKKWLNGFVNFFSNTN